MKKVSVVVPAYNAQKVISRCVESILNQTYRNIEVILIDDGSTDKTLQECKKYSFDERVIIYHQANAGVSAARNQGINMASGEFLIFVDADDYVEEELVNKLMESQNSNNADMVICGYRKMTLIASDICVKSKEYENTKEFNDVLLEGFNKVLLNPPWIKLFKMSLLRNRFDENISLGEDLLFNLEYLDKAEKINFIEYIGYNYIISSQGLHQRYRKEDLELYSCLWEKTTQYFKRYNDIRLIEAATYRFLINCYGYIQAAFQHERGFKVKYDLLSEVANTKTIRENCISEFEHSRIKIIYKLLKEKKILFLFMYIQFITYVKKCRGRR